MRRPIELLAEAARDLERAIWWYEHERPGLGKEFLKAFKATTDRVRDMPEGHQLVARRTRKALLRRFPYIVLYANDSDRHLNTAVFHAHRDPARWADRVRERAHSTEAFEGSLTGA